MPGRNIIKEYQPQSFYHVYNRGVNKRLIYLNEHDYEVFLGLLKKCLAIEAREDTLAKDCKWYGDRVELLAFCLMPNHFHMLWYQHDSKAITQVMKSIITAYVMYFNKRYGRVGPLFQQRFRAVDIMDDPYLLHISRYIHLNPDKYDRWHWSSWPYYVGNSQATWINPGRILELFNDRAEYLNFVADYKDYRNSLQLLKTEIEQ